MKTKSGVNVVEHENRIELEFFGRIDEDFDFSNISFEIQKTYVFDLEKLESLNSMGIRNWLTFFKKMTNSSSKIFVNCHKVVIDQINILRGFLPSGAIVASFYLPYYCQACEKDFEFKVERDRDFNEATVDAAFKINLVDEKRCSKCGGHLEIDFYPERYFKFLQL